MLYTVFLHLAMLASKHVAAYEYVGPVAIDIVAVVVDSDDVFISKEKDAVLLGEWIARESALRPRLGGDRDANGVATSFGEMQIKAVWFKLCETSEEILMSDRRANIACGYKILKHLKNEVCGGSVRGALRAYGSGTCAGSVKMRAKVESRCASSGAC